MKGSTKHLPPVLMNWNEVVDIKTAMQHSDKSEATIRRLCKTYRIARQTFPNAPLEISLPALEMALGADTEALDLLRQGHRSHERVQSYLRHLGLPTER